MLSKRLAIWYTCGQHIATEVRMSDKILRCVCPTQAAVPHGPCRSKAILQDNFQTHSSIFQTHNANFLRPTADPSQPAPGCPRTSALVEQPTTPHPPAVRTWPTGPAEMSAASLGSLP